MRKYMLTQDQALTQKCTKYFIIFCFVHILFWTVVPYVTLGALPFDTAESIAWGNQWMLGYNKHPPLAAWVTTIAFNLGGDFGVYLLAQLAIIICFIAIWRLSLRYFSAPLALLSVVLLEGNLSFTLVSPNFNPTAIMVPLWALMFLTFYHALKSQKISTWLWLGFLAGLNVLAKYQVVILFVPMLFIMLYTTEGRISFRKLGMYLGLLLSVIVVAPHFIYSYTQSFPEIHYAMGSTFDRDSFMNHFLKPLNMTINQLGTIAGILVIGLPLMLAKTRAKIELASFDRTYLFVMALGPFVATILLSAISGSNLGNNWFVPYFSMLGMVVIYLSRPVLTRKNVRAVCILLCIAFFGLLIGRFGAVAFQPYFTQSPNSKAYFPGKSIAMKATDIWHQHYHDRLSYVSGDHYITAFVNIDSPDHPVPLMGWKESESPWINMKEMRRRGAMFVWYAKNKYDVMFSHVDADRMPEKIKKEFPRAEYLGVYDFKIAVPFGNYSPIRIGMAILPPEK